MKLYVIRGIPGSGKSTLAKSIQSEIPYSEHWEADMYFVDKSGEYKFDKSRISQSHEWCFRNVQDSLNSGHDTIVSNTFCSPWEMEDYFTLGERLGCEIVVIECTGNYGSIHGVPQETLDRMKSRFIHNSDLWCSEQKHELKQKTTYSYEYRSI